ncbi:MAG: hypothetical protein RSF78_11845 [Bacteroidales bacterium]
MAIHFILIVLSMTGWKGFVRMGMNRDLECRTDKLGADDVPLEVRRNLARLCSQNAQFVLDGEAK